MKKILIKYILMINFKDKKILITGATGGIGNALVKKFVSLEGNVFATGTKTEKLNALKKEFPNINILKFDISDHSKIEGFIENASSQLVGLDILVNNAGITKDNILLRMKEDEWDDIINTNLSSIYKMSKAVLRGMIKNRSGRIISITSVVGAMGNAGLSSSVV
jgi:3-oxoacyl-[acyl-carrier protein] reductase